MGGEEEEEDMVIIPLSESGSSHHKAGKDSSLTSFSSVFQGFLGRRMKRRDLVDEMLLGDYREVPPSARGCVWRILTGSLDEESLEFEGDWVASLNRSRKAFESLKDRHSLDSRDNNESWRDLLLDNPLSTDDSSSWNQYFLNSRLREEIQRDVVRTYPGIPSFQTCSVRGLLTEVLFIYAKEHPDLAYKQGMHEILAAVVVVLKTGINEYFRFKSAGSSELFNAIFDPLYLEHDAYTVFEKIMEHMRNWYWVPPSSPPSVRPRKCDVFSSEPDRLFNDASLANQVRETCNASKRLSRMWDHLLAVNDRELYEHLKNLGIIPTTFGINWMKLMYSRQFFSDFEFLRIWDVIIATNFELHDYVLIAMLIAVRSKLIKGDNTTCNRILITSYPKEVDCQYVIEMSLYLYDDVRFPKPSKSPFKSFATEFSDGAGNSTVPERRIESKKKDPVKNRVYKSVELIEYLSADDTRNKLEILGNRVSSWKEKLESNVEFLRDIFKDQDIEQVDKFDRALYNFEKMIREMESVIDSSKKKQFSSRTSGKSTSLAKEALEYND